VYVQFRVYAADLSRFLIFSRGEKGGAVPPAPQAVSERGASPFLISSIISCLFEKNTGQKHPLKWGKNEGKIVMQNERGGRGAGHNPPKQISGSKLERSVVRWLQ